MSEHLQTSDLTESRVNVKLFLRTILANPRSSSCSLPHPQQFRTVGSRTMDCQTLIKTPALGFLPSPPAPGYLSTRAIRNLTTGLSFIGRWTMAANTPKATPAHHIAS